MVGVVAVVQGPVALGGNEHWKILEDMEKPLVVEYFADTLVEARPLAFEDI